MFAVRNHHTSTVRLLLQNGADLSMTDSKKVTPLYCELILYYNTHSAYNFFICQLVGCETFFFNAN